MLSYWIGGQDLSPSMLLLYKSFNRWSSTWRYWGLEVNNRLLQIHCGIQQLSNTGLITRPDGISALLSFWGTTSTFLSEKDRKKTPRDAGVAIEESSGACRLDKCHSHGCRCVMILQWAQAPTWASDVVSLEPILDTLTIDMHVDGHNTWWMVDGFRRYLVPEGSKKDA